jgi:hypothetical protein
MAAGGNEAGDGEAGYGGAAGRRGGRSILAPLSCVSSGDGAKAPAAGHWLKASANVTPMTRRMLFILLTVWSLDLIGGGSHRKKAKPNVEKIKEAFGKVPARAVAPPCVTRPHFLVPRRRGTRLVQQARRAAAAAGGGGLTFT